MSQDNPYDEKHVRSLPWNLTARIEEKHDDPSKRTLIVKNSEVETYCHFDLSLPNDESNADSGDHKNWREAIDSGRLNLAAAIEHAVTSCVEMAATEEAGRWITDHETVYVVQGQTGKPTDGPTGRDRWAVKAFLSEERAHDLMRTLNHWCCQHGVSRVAYEDPMKRMIIDPEGKVASCPLDPKFRIDETGVLYTIVEIPLDMFDPIREG